MAEANIAVIIPSRGRDACLKQTLRDLSLQSSKEFEVWLVDQNDTPLQGMSECVGTVPFHHETMPPRGSHAGRNHAIFRTKAAICLFVDDDVRLEKDFVENHAQAHRAMQPPVVCVVGRVVQPKDNLTELQMKQQGKLASYSAWTGRISGNFIGETEGLIDHIHECNFSVKTDILKKIGGFNEEFRGNAYFEGADLALRIKQTGARINYQPSLSLIHLQEGAGGNRVNQKSKHTYWFLRNYGLVNSLHMHKIGLPLFVAYALFYVLGKSAKNQSFEILKQGLSGLFHGLWYFVPGVVRLKTHSLKEVHHA
jgi:GT2 family glycosyltransferase